MIPCFIILCSFLAILLQGETVLVRNELHQWTDFGFALSSQACVRSTKIPSGAQIVCTINGRLHLAGALKIKANTSWILIGEGNASLWFHENTIIQLEQMATLEVLNLALIAPPNLPISAWDSKSSTSIFGLPLQLGPLDYDFDNDSDSEDMSAVTITNCSVSLNCGDWVLLGEAFCNEGKFAGDAEVRTKLQACHRAGQHIFFRTKIMHFRRHKFLSSLILHQSHAFQI